MILIVWPSSLLLWNLEVWTLMKRLTLWHLLSIKEHGSYQSSQMRNSIWIFGNQESWWGPIWSSLSLIEFLIDLSTKINSVFQSMWNIFQLSSNQFSFQRKWDNCGKVMIHLIIHLLSLKCQTWWKKLWTNIIIPSIGTPQLDIWSIVSSQKPLNGWVLTVAYIFAASWCHFCFKSLFFQTCPKELFGVIFFVLLLNCISCSSNVFKCKTLDLLTTLVTRSTKLI